MNPFPGPRSNGHVASPGLPDAPRPASDEAGSREQMEFVRRDSPSERALSIPAAWEIESDELSEALARSKALHGRLCPRQVLGVRIGFAGGRALGMPVPTRDNRLLAVAETDGCFLDGLAAATGCAPGHRTLRIEDYGKVAATFVNLASGEALRVAPRSDVRERASALVPEEARKYYAQLLGYQRMPGAELLRIEPVQLVQDLAAIRGRAGVRVDCAGCGEEVINAREQDRDGRPSCRGCGDAAYYRVKSSLS